MPKSPVPCAASMTNEARSPTTTVFAKPQRKSRPPMNPSGTKKTTLNAICGMTEKPSRMKSPMGASGFSCHGMPYVMPGPASPLGSG